MDPATIAFCTMVMAAQPASKIEDKSTVNTVTVAPALLPSKLTESSSFLKSQDTTDQAVNERLELRKEIGESQDLNEVDGDAGVK